MTFGNPLALAWVAAIGVLLWLWRFVGARHRIPVSSLVPFQHLMRRLPSRRARRVANLLFWLQLAALALLAAALADPRWPSPSVRTTLVLVDTSASMAAAREGGSALQQAQARVREMIDRLKPSERLFIVTTAPIDRLTEGPLSDAMPLRAAAERLHPAQLAGNLALSWRVGQLLLGASVDRTVVLTDEPSPVRVPPSVAFESLGGPVPNVAIVGVDTHQSLCVPTAALPGGSAEAADAKLVVWAQNFSAEAQQATVRLTRDGRPLAEQSLQLEPQRATPVTFPMLEDADGLVEATVSAERDALVSDNRVVMPLQAEPIHAAVALERPELAQRIGAWLAACPRVQWTAADASDAEAAQAGTVLITDQPARASAWPGPTLLIDGGQGATMQLARWVAEGPHPIADYLEPLVVVPTATDWSRPPLPWGDPVVWGIAQGRKVPLIGASSAGGRRAISWWFDPIVVGDAVPPVLAFFNGLRWLGGASALSTTGQSLAIGPLPAGAVRVTRPSGESQSLAHDGGLLRYDRTDEAGWYVFTQGDRTIRRAVNFLDPVESNLQQPHSTWFDASEPPVRSDPSKEGFRSLAPELMAVLFGVLVLEWLLYAWRARRREPASAVPQPSPRRPAAAPAEPSLTR